MADISALHRTRFHCLLSISEFKHTNKMCVVATDVAARGLGMYYTLFCGTMTITSF